jgi:hypothetical protein
MEQLWVQTPSQTEAMGTLKSCLDSSNVFATIESRQLTMKRKPQPTIAQEFQVATTCMLETSSSFDDTSVSAQEVAPVITMEPPPA